MPVDLLASADDQTEPRDLLAGQPQSAPRDLLADAAPKPDARAQIEQMRSAEKQFVPSAPNPVFQVTDPLMDVATLGSWRAAQPDLSNVLPAGVENARRNVFKSAATGLGSAMAGFGDYGPLAKVAGADTGLLEKAGNALKRSAEATYPTDPERDKTLLQGKVPSLVGGVVPIFAAGPGALAVAGAQGVEQGGEVADQAGVTGPKKALLQTAHGVTNAFLGGVTSKIGGNAAGGRVANALVHGAQNVGADVVTDYANRGIDATLANQPLDLTPKPWQDYAAQFGLGAATGAMRTPEQTRQREALKVAERQRQLSEVEQKIAAEIAAEDAAKSKAVGEQYNLPAGPKSVVGPRPKFDAPFEDNRPAVVGPTPQFDTPFEDNRPAVVGPKFTPNDLQKAPEAQDANAPGYTLTKQGKSEVGPKFDQEALTKTPEAQPANDVLTSDPYGFTAKPLEGNKPVAEPLDIYGRPTSDATSPLQPPDGGDSPTASPKQQTRQKPANSQDEASVKPEGPAIAENNPPLPRTAQDTARTAEPSPSASGQGEASTPKPTTYDLIDSAGNKVSEHLSEAAASSARDRLGDPRARIKGRGRQGGFVDVGAVADAAKGAAKAGANLTNETAGAALRGFSEDLPDALARNGKEKSAEASQSGRRAIDKGKQLFGSVSKEVDSAVDAVRMAGKTSTYLQEIAPSKSGSWGIRRIVDAVEGGNVPELARAAVDKVRTANLAIGKMAEPFIEGFKATGKFQRNWTNYGFDIIRSGGGKAWDTLTQAYAEANGKTPEGVRAYFKSLKAELDAPGGEASYRRINQEFTREFPKAPTDIKVNGGWVSVLHANPVEYLQTSAQRSAMRAGVLSEPSLSGEGFAATRAAVAAESGSSGGTHLDRMVRALHGIPEGVTGPKPGTASRTLVDAGKRVATDVLKPMYLSGSAVSNLAESVAGSVPTTMGVRNAVRGAARIAPDVLTRAIPEKFGLRQAVREALGVKDAAANLESKGATNKAVYDWSVDPHGLTKTGLRWFRNGVTKLSMQRGINELQEMHAAATADVVAERLQSGKIGNGILARGERAKLAEQFVNMGFERPRAEAMAQGKGTTADYQAMVRRAAAYMTGGNKATAEGSRFQNNRTLSQLLPFQGYSIKQVNLLRKNVNSFAEALGSGDRSRKIAAARNLGRFVVGTTIQGAATTALLAMASGGAEGLKIAKNEAKDEPGKFLIESFFYRGVGGPLSVASNLTSRPVNLNIADINASSTFVGSQIAETFDIINGSGRYKDQSALERAKTYFTKRVPGGRILNTIVGTLGAGDSDPATDSSITAFYRWRRSELGVSQTNTATYDSEDEQQTRAFRLHMRRAADDIKATRDPTKNIEAAIGVKGADLKKLTSSLQGRKILKGVGGKKLTPEQLDSFKKRVGEEAFNRVKNYDAMLEGWADAINYKPDPIE